MAPHEREVERPPRQPEERHPDQLLLEEELQERNAPVERLSAAPGCRPRTGGSTARGTSSRGSRALDAARPRAAATPIRRKIAPLQPIQPRRSQIMSAARPPAPRGERHEQLRAAPRPAGSAPRTTTFSTISEIVTTPFSVEPPRCCTCPPSSPARGVRLCPGSNDPAWSMRMPLELTAHEARVIGCLIEKQIATPDQYPLSLNALINACNQKSNRDPVLDLEEREVQAVVDGAHAASSSCWRSPASAAAYRSTTSCSATRSSAVAEVLARADGHRLRTAAARPADPGRTAHPRRAARAVARPRRGGEPRSRTSRRARTVRSS